MQAQEYQDAKWALALRMTRTTDALIEEAMTDGRLLRTHVLRPTWHFVAAEDIGGHVRTRQELKTALQGGGIAADGVQRLAHIVMQAERCGEDVWRAAERLSEVFAPASRCDPLGMNHRRQSCYCRGASMNDRPDFLKITALLDRLDQVCREAQQIRAQLAAVTLPSTVRVERLAVA